MINMTDCEFIQSMIDAADDVTVPPINPRDGSNVWEISEPLILRGGKRVLLDGCTLRLRDGVYSNIFITEGAWDTDARPLRDISITGRNGAVLDGGIHNGLTERTYKSGGLPHVLHNTLILMRGVSGFTVSGLTLRSLRYWGMTFYYSSEGSITDIEFDADNSATNQDGIDLRLGCHDIEISDIRGSTGDDSIALTALYHPFDRSFALNGMQDDLHDVKIKGVRAESTGGHGIIRLLCHDGIKMYNIEIEDIYDAAIDTHGAKCQAAIRLGDVNYWTLRPAEVGDMRDITIIGVRTCACEAIKRKTEIPGLKISDVKLES